MHRLTCKTTSYNRKPLYSMFVRGLLVLAHFKEKLLIEYRSSVIEAAMCLTGP